MKMLLRLWRLFAVVCWFQVAALCAALVLPWGWWGIQRVTRITRMWGWGLCRILGMRIQIHGQAPAGFHYGLVVSNHLSYIDILIHAAMFPLRFSAKAEIAGWPVIGWYLGLNRPIWVDRQSRQKAGRTKAQFAETLAHGISLIVYPEGTSTDGKHGILPFKSTSFEAVSGGGDGEAAMIQPILIRYVEEPGRPTVCWFGDAELLPHIWMVLGTPRIDAEVRFLPPVAPAGRDRKTLAVDVHDQMDRAYRDWV
jgi:1-acyl-sn-glycerol-3-phosphate acyltransferase